MKTYEIENGISVITSSIRYTGVQDNNNHDNSKVMHAINTNGTHLIYISTNGSNIAITDDVNNNTNICCDMGLGNISIGKTLIQNGIEITQDLYEDNPEALEELQWFLDQIEIVDL